MPALVDLHVHLLAGLDDGPRTWEDALAMCRILAQEGVGAVAATAHQNERYAAVTPDRIRAAAGELAARVAQEGLPLQVLPNAEVMAAVDVDEAWAAHKVLSVGDRGRYLLMEMPHQLFVDLRPTVARLKQAGVRVILAHPERHPELLHEPGAIEELIGLGCLVQVSTGSVTEPASAADARVIRGWFRRGVVHVLGSDGHSPRRRKPLMAAAYAQVVRWVGPAAAEQVGSGNAAAILRGEPVKVAPPRPERRWWPLW
jgi:protein-tyrosine phosphatase